jgi:hypothetical protein
MKQTAVEWLVKQLINLDRPNYTNRRILAISKNSLQEKEFNELVKQAKEMEKQRMIDLVQRLKDYTRESHNVLGFDEREACEFVELFNNQTFKSE